MDSFSGASPIEHSGVHKIGLHMPFISMGLKYAYIPWITPRTKTLGHDLFRKGTQPSIPILFCLGCYVMFPALAQ